MNLTTVRDTIATLVNTACTTNLPTYPVFYENGPAPDLNQIGEEFLYVSVGFDSGRQAELGVNPKARYTGHLSLTFMKKATTGTKSLLQKVDTLTGALKNVTISDLHLATPTPGRTESHDGWYSQEWAIPFWTHN